MKNKIKEILIKLNDWKFIILILIIISGAFYWFQVRPSVDYSSCNKQARKYINDNYESKDYINNVNDLRHLTADDLAKIYDIRYQICLRDLGINK
ncbi:MAG: hypothetical protein WCI41_02105 [bacterium]